MSNFKQCVKCGLTYCDHPKNLKDKLCRIAFKILDISVMTFFIFLCVVLPVFFVITMFHETPVLCIVYGITYLVIAILSFLQYKSGGLF